MGGKKQDKENQKEKKDGKEHCVKIIEGPYKDKEDQIMFRFNSNQCICNL